MNDDHLLTVLLPVKDRAPFTIRWLSYANEIRFPFKVLIADGSSDDSTGRVLGFKAHFPNVDYEYVRYPHDDTYSRYYAKMAEAAARVTTPFVAIGDNDDFFVVNGLRESVRFLADHLGYATCGGQCAIFWMTPPAAD